MKKNMTTLVLLCIFLVSCKMDYDVIKRDSNIESISVDTSAAKKTSYVVTESFDSTGIKVIAHYTDGTSQEVDISLVAFENFSSESPNPALPVTVKYQDLTATFNVCIKENEIIKINVIQTPHKLHYHQNDSPDYNGLLVIGENILQERKLLTSEEYTITNFGFSNADVSGMNLLTVSYNNNPDIKTFFSIFFDDWEVDKIEIVPPNKRHYIKGIQTIRLNDLTVTVKKANSSQFESIRPTEYSIEPGDITTLDTGSHEIKVWVNDKSATFKIDIVDAYVSGMEVDKGSYSNCAFYDGDEKKFFSFFKFYEKLETTESQTNLRGDQITEEYLRNSKSSLKCKYNDEKINIENSDSQVKLTGTGIQTLEFEYTFHDIKNDKDVTVTCPIEIYVGASQLESISAKWMGNGYPLGVKPDNSNSEYGSWTITGLFKNEDTKTISADYCHFEYSDGEIEKIKDSVLNGNEEECPVSVTYADKKCEVDVTVVCPEVIGITVELNEGNEKPIKQGESEANLKGFITVRKILKYIPERPLVTENGKIVVKIYEIQNDQELWDGLLTVNYDNKFSAFLDIKIEPKIDLSQSNDITISLEEDITFNMCKNKLKITKNGNDITNKLDIDVEEEYNQNVQDNQRKWLLNIKARQKTRAYGDTYSPWIIIGNINQDGYIATEQEPRDPDFDIQNITVSRLYVLNGKKITKTLIKDEDFRVDEKSYSVYDSEGNAILRYDRPYKSGGQ